MSVAQFSKVLFDHFISTGKSLPRTSFRTRILDTNRDNPKNIYPSEEFRSTVSQAIGKFDLLIKLSDVEGGDLSSVANVLTNKGISSFKYIGNKEAILVSKISWDTAGKLAKSVTSQAKALGHVYGSATGMVDYYNKEISTKLPQYPELQSAITKILDDFSRSLKNFDALTASIPTSIAPEISAKYDKNFTDRGAKFLVELQDNSENSSAGNHVKQKFDQLRKLISAIEVSAGRVRGSSKYGFDAVHFTEDKQYQEALKSLLSGIGTSPNRVSWEHLEGSKSLVQYLEQSIYGILTTGKPLPVESSKGKASIKPNLRIGIRNPYSDISRVVSELRKRNEEYKRAAYSISNNRARLNGRFVSLIGLQSIINSSLAEQIKANMGTGDSRSVLNYRTGRFAESAKVDRISISREGAITAFYTYMKAPYQTFEPGFAQGTPASRNPRLLISSSIRDIASKLITNRLRSVVV